MSPGERPYVCDLVLIERDGCGAGRGRWPHEEGDQRFRLGEGDPAPGRQVDDCASAAVEMLVASRPPHLHHEGLHRARRYRGGFRVALRPPEDNLEEPKAPALCAKG